MKSDLPLIIYQPTDCFYLDKAISLNNQFFKDIKIIKENNYIKFEKIYKHMSSNHYGFELFCFIRYFLILNYVKENKIEKFIYSDTDAIFFDFFDFDSFLGSSACVACKPEDQDFYDHIVSAHFSIWTRQGLESFCDFLMNTYSNNIDILKPKWEWHLKTKNLGGICDMTLLYHWYKESKNLLNVNNKNTFDRNINTSDNNKRNEFQTNGSIKQIKIIQNRAVGKNSINEDVNFIGLHFQGNAKNLILNL